MSYATTERIAMNHAAEEIKALKALVADLRSALVETTADAEMYRALAAGQGKEIAALREACLSQAGVGSGEDEGE